MSMGVFMPPPAPLMTGGGGTGFFTFDTVTMQVFQIVPVDQQSGIIGIMKSGNGTTLAYTDGNVYGAETTIEFSGNTGFFLGTFDDGGGGIMALYIFPLDGTYPTGTPNTFVPGPNITVTDNGTPTVYESYISFGTVNTLIGATSLESSPIQPPSNYFLGNVIQSPGFVTEGLIWIEGDLGGTQIDITNGEFPDIIFEFNGDTISGGQWVSAHDGRTYITVDAEFYNTWPTSGTHPFTLRLP